MKIEKNKVLAPLTTFGIGGKADYLITAKTKAEIIKAVKWVNNKQINWFVLGKGSNILIADKGIRGAVIKIKNSKFKIHGLKIEVEAGLSLARLLNICWENSLTGLEFLAGIPGSIGGALVSNAGVKKKEISLLVEKVLVLTPNGKLVWLNNQQCQLGYRSSRFLKNKEIILAAVLSLSKAKKKKIKAKMKKYLLKRTNQPKGKSAGSIFKNPAFAPAGYLIEKVGLKGKKIGGAKISCKHANWIINFNQATAKNVLDLIKLAKQKVKKNFKIVLKEEIVLKGEF